MINDKTDCSKSTLNSLTFNRFNISDVFEDTDVENSHEEVRNHAYVRSLLLLGLCGGPVKSVQDVLAE